jgi:hypothetical protein
MFGTHSVQHKVPAAKLLNGPIDNLDIVLPHNHPAVKADRRILPVVILLQRFTMPFVKLIRFLYRHLFNHRTSPVGPVIALRAFIGFVGLNLNKLN